MRIAGKAVTTGCLPFNLHGWRNAVASPAGPSRTSTRLVLLTLALHMNPQGVAWPSQQTLAKRSGLCLRTVQACLDDAEEGAWIVRSWRGRNGQGWRRALYQATIPAHIDLATKPWETSSAWKREARIAAVSTERGATTALPSTLETNKVVQVGPDVAQPVKKRGAKSARKVVQPLRTNSPSEFLKELTIPEGVLKHAESVNKFAEKKADPEAQPCPTAAPEIGIDPFANGPEVVQESIIVEPRPKPDLKPAIRRLLEAGQAPGDVQKILRSRGCTHEDVREAMT